MSSPTNSESSADRKKTPTSWDPHDDMVLRHLKEQLKLGWKEIAANFPNRTTNACQFRWRRLMSGNLRSAKPPAPTNPHESITSLSGSGTPNSSSEPIQIPGSGDSPAISSAGSQGLTRTQTSSPSPVPSRQHYYYPPAATSIHSSASTNTKTWSKEEDDLLSSRRDLRTDELALLLPQRGETEIIQRVSQLNFSSSVSPTSSPASVSFPNVPSSPYSRDRSSSTSSTASSVSVTSSSPYLGTDFSRRPILSNPRSSSCFGDLKKLPAPISQRRSSIPYSPVSFTSSTPSEWAYSSRKSTPLSAAAASPAAARAGYSPPAISS